jgi:hypothetical protein
MPGEDTSPDAAVMKEATKVVEEGGIIKFDIDNWASPGRTVAIPTSRCSIGIESGQWQPDESALEAESAEAEPHGHDHLPIAERLIAASVPFRFGHNELFEAVVQREIQTIRMLIIATTSAAVLCSSSAFT